MADELILVVEDNPLNLKLLRDVLGARGYRVAEAMSAEEGLEIARARRPALILMDVRLPGMDGIAALRELRRDSATREIPVVAITASAMRASHSVRSTPDFRLVGASRTRVPE